MLGALQRALKRNSVLSPSRLTGAAEKAPSHSSPYVGLGHSRGGHHRFVAEAVAGPTRGLTAACRPLRACREPQRDASFHANADAHLAEPLNDTTSRSSFRSATARRAGGENSLLPSAPVMDPFGATGVRLAPSFQPQATRTVGPRSAVLTPHRSSRRAARGRRSGASPHTPGSRSA